MRRIREFYANITRRVLLIPAITGVILVFLCVYTDIVITILLTFTFLTILFCVTEKRGRQFMSFLVTICVCLFLCWYFILYNSDNIEVPQDRITFDCKVHIIEHTLDDVYKIRVYSKDYGFLEFKATSDYIPTTGEEITVTGDMFEPEKPRNPGQFDYRYYLKRRGVGAFIKVISIESLEKASLLNRYLSAGEDALFRLRTRILTFYEEKAPLAAAVFMGDSSLTEDSIRSMYQRNGCAHLLAVSGTHFTGFLSLLAYFLNKYRKTHLSAVIYVFFCILLASFTGWSSSVTRSCVMCSASYCSKDALSGLSIACLVMTLADPYNALSYGFLMTCSASIGILYVTPLIRKKADRLLGKTFSSVISPVVASHVGMLPFIAVTSQKYGVIPLAVQIITSFIASSACAFFVPSVLLSILISSIFIFPSYVMISLLDAVVSFADLYYFGASVSTSVSVAVLFLLVVLLFRSSALGRLFKLPAVIILCVSILSSIIGIFIAPSAKIVFIDVGQGDSCLIMSSGKTVLIDGGTYDAGKDDVMPVLDYYDIRHVDVAIATHWDRDHIGGLIYLLEQGIADKIYTSFVEYGPKQLEIMQEYELSEPLHDLFIMLSAGDKIEMSDSCTLDVIYPLEGMVTDGENDDSLVIRVVCEQISVLLTGDLGIDKEEEFLENSTIGKTDILKAGHHGSAFSTGYELLEDISPDVAVISAGVNNLYGHPSQETLSRLDEYDVQVISTQDAGAITVDIYPERYVITGFLKSH